jgi:hypothetical protein
MNYEFDLATAIAEHLDGLGISTEVDCDFDRNDPDRSNSYDLYVSWEEDGDTQSFTVRDCQRFTLEDLFDQWVRERDALHAHFLNWLANEASEEEIANLNI